MFNFLFAVLAAAIFADQPPVELPTGVPLSGTYLSMAYVPSSQGIGCVIASGSQLLAEVSYGGLSSKTIYIRSPYAASNGQVISVQVLTVTGGAGTLTPSGTFTWSGYGSNSWNLSGTFTASITEVGSHAFMLNLTQVHGRCTESLQISLVRTGINNN